MSFDKILAHRGLTITQIAITRAIVQGYTEEIETETDIKAIVQPLSSNELAFWSGAGGIEKASLKVFLKADISVGDKIEIDGEQYPVGAVENHGDAKLGDYKKAVVGRHG